ncbi:MAG: hypothetical protein ABSH13_15400 [Candidatus Acidiferrum sp.]|jgi:hypothetical protein
MRRIWMVGSFFLILPGVATAQHRGGMGVAGPVVAVAPRGVAGGAPHVVARVPAGTRPATVVRHTRAAGTPSRNIGVASGLTNLPVFSSGMNVPGLGFDYPHLAAVNPQHGRGRSGFGAGVPFGYGYGGYLLSPEIVVENPQAVEEAQQGPPDDSGANPVVADAGSGAERQYYSRPAPEPPVDTSEYVFVRRDGGLLFAVAYSWDNGTLRYVTRDGVRKSVTQDALDMDATQQFNEQRGLSFRVPA